MAAETENRRTGLFTVALLAVIVAAAVLRIAAARGELWLDEVWSVQLIQENVRKPSDILLNLAHDNNHFLNSFWIDAVGFDAAAWVYRAPAVAAGILTVLAAGWVQRRSGRAAVVSTIVLTGCSYLLIHYSSEARGYAYLMLFSMLALAVLNEADESPRLAWDGLLAAICILGFLAHPMFLIVFLSSQVWTWLPPCPSSIGRKTATFLLRTVIPGLFFAWLYWVALRPIMLGGGEIHPYGHVILQTLSLTIGGPLDGWGAYGAAGATLLFTCAAFWRAWHLSTRRFSFYLAAIVVLPIVIVEVVPRPDVYPRYFLTSVLFALLLWSDFLEEVCRRTSRGKWWASLFLAAFVLTNGWRLWQLIDLGRSHYQDALETMTDGAQRDPVLIAVDHPFRQNMMLGYYSSRMPLKKQIQTATISPDSLITADWLLVHSSDESFHPLPSISKFGNTFRLVKHYPFPGLSGWHLCVYQRER